MRLNTLALLLALLLSVNASGLAVGTSQCAGQGCCCDGMEGRTESAGRQAFSTPWKCCDRESGRPPCWFVADPVPASQALAHPVDKTEPKNFKAISICRSITPHDALKSSSVIQGRRQSLLPGKIPLYIQNTSFLC